MTARIYALVGFFLLDLSVAASALANDSKPGHPNVLFIAVDDLNDWVEGLSNYAGAKTPNINRLAQRGVLFTNAHCAAPACNPSRVSILTGVRPSTSGVYLNSQDWRDCKNLSGVATLPQHFGDNGYKVLGGGKIYHAASLSDAGHTGYLDGDAWDEYFPSKMRQLPTEVKPDTFPLNGSSQFYHGYMDWAQLDIPDAEMGDAKVVSWAEQLLSANHDKPLFLAVGIYRPHIPWYTPKSWYDKFPIESVVLPEIKEDDLDDVPTSGQEMARRHWHKWMVDEGKWRDAVQAYLASVSFADAMIGRLLDALDAGPHASNTVIVLWSDHGYHLGHKEHWEKFALWEQTTHVPLIVAAPNSAGAGKRCERPTSLLDIFPTLVDLCNLSGRDNLDGTSLKPFLDVPSATSDDVAITTHGLNNHAVRTQHWRYVRYADGSEELYDHRKDPNEFENLAGGSSYDQTKHSLAAHIPSINVAPCPGKDAANPLRKKADQGVQSGVEK